MPNLKFSIFNFQFSIKKGFTLIEFLVVLGILVVTVGSTLLFLTSVLRGSNKATVETEVKQNGQTVLNQLEKQIRNAIDAQDKDDFSALGPNTIKLFRQDDIPLYVKCLPYTNPPNAVNGSIGIVASASTTPPLDSAYISLTNRLDRIAGVDIDCGTPPCGLTVISSSTGVYSPPIVSVCFVASQGKDAPSRQDFQANIKFQSTISLRKY
jgi:prepilin-type N-terminal cleavage/methylation domain-containing protein